jgi:hypothetical protein
VDYSNAKRQQGIVPGCAAIQGEEPERQQQSGIKDTTAAQIQSSFISKIVKEIKDVCKDHRCKNGRCIPSKNGKEYTCRCTPGFGGRFCEEGMYYSLHPLILQDI